jgi:hypothetical protein
MGWRSSAVTRATRQLWIDVARARYDADVRLAAVEPSSTWWGDLRGRPVGYVARIGRDPLSRQPFASADAAWDAILERLVIVRPGVLKLTSVEFGDRTRRARPGGDAGLVEVIERQRLEIRAMGDESSTFSPSVALPDQIVSSYQVFRLTRQYRDDAPSRDVSQVRVGSPAEPYRFRTLGAAAEYVVKAVSIALLEHPAHAITALGVPAEGRGQRMRPAEELATSLDIGQRPLGVEALSQRNPAPPVR